MNGTNVNNNGAVPRRSASLPRAHARVNGRPEKPYALFIVMCYGACMKPKEIREAVKREYGVALAESSIRGYSPNSERFRPEWLEVFRRAREKWIAEAEQFPLAHKRGRAEALSRVYEEAMEERVVQIIPGRGFNEPAREIRGKDLTNATRALDLLRREFEGDKLTLNGRIGIYPAQPEPDFDRVREELKKAGVLTANGQVTDWDQFDRIREAFRRVQERIGSRAALPALTEGTTP